MIKNKDFKILSEIHGISLEEAKIIEFLPGVSIGPKLQELRRYEIVSLLGVGSSGCVYLVKDYEDNQNLYALKIILPHILNNQEQVNAFIEIINDLYEFDHSNVLSVLDLWQQKKLYFYITDYIEGMNLEEWVDNIKLKGRYVSIIDVCNIMLQVCEGVKYLHGYNSHGLLHANNILLKEEEGKVSVHLTDFGIQGLFISNIKERLKKSIYGKYLAPEFLNGGINDKLCDIYSIGILMYRMLTYEFPTSEDSRVSTIRYDIPPTIDDIILRAMSKKPEDRYNVIDELLDDLKMFKKDISSRKGRTLRMEKMPDTSTKRRRVQEATGVLSILAEKYKQKAPVDEGSSLGIELDDDESAESTNNSNKSEKKEYFQIHDTQKNPKNKVANVNARVEDEYNELAKQVKPETENSLKKQFSMNLKFKNQSLSDIGPLEAIPINSSDDDGADAILRTETTKWQRDEILKRSSENEIVDEGDVPEQTLEQVNKSAEEEASSDTKEEVVGNKMKRYFPKTDNDSTEEEASSDTEEEIPEFTTQVEQEVSEQDTSATIDGQEQEENTAPSEENVEDKVIGNKMKRYFPSSLNFEETESTQDVEEEPKQKEIGKASTITSISELKEEIESRSLLEDISKPPPLTKNKLKKYFPMSSDENTEKEEEETSDEKEVPVEDMSSQVDSSDEISTQEKVDLPEDSASIEQESEQEESEDNTQTEKNLDSLPTSASQDSKQEEYEEETISEDVRVADESHIVCPKVIDAKQQEMQDILTEGDDLANQGLFEDAIMKWQHVVDFVDPIEIEDRIMQIVDMSAEMAQEKLDEDNCYEAKKILDVVMPYTTDDFVENLYEEVLEKVKEQEQNFQSALEQVNNHLQKKQYQAAIQILTSIRDSSPDMELIDTKIEEISKIQNQVQADEEEYMQLLFTAKLLEEKSSYYEALQTFEKIRQKQSRWLCPVADISADMERVSKLVASTEVSEKANKILTQIEKLVSEGKWREAKEEFKNPVFSRKLVPKVEKRVKEKQDKVANLEKQHHAKIQKMYIAAGAAVLIVIAACCYFFLF